MANLTVAPGAHIELRDAVWRVLKTEQTAAGASAWHCVGISEIVKDQEAIFLESLEPTGRAGVKVLAADKTALVPDGSPGHRQSLVFIESLLRDVPPTDPALYVGHTAAMDVLDFQLESAALALARRSARILIADNVGLGKTLQAGILLAELMRRGQARRILVATTRSMLTQFQKEMWCRFSIPLVRLDSAGLQRIRATIPTHHNPFHHFDRAIVSIDTLKQNNAFRGHVEKARWDVVVIDEAHNVATRGTRSQRAWIAQVLAQSCDHLILLSATPHDGKPRSFASLMNMLDPTAITDPDAYKADEIRGLYVRRFKHQVASQLGDHVPPRSTAKIRCRASVAEEVAFDRLTGLALTRLDQRRTGAMLFRTTLEKALFSSPAACIETIDNRVRQLGCRDDAAQLAGDVQQLEALRRDLVAIEPADFSKLQRLIVTIGESGWTGRKKTDRLVIFTERVATLSYLAEQLPPALGLTPEQVEVLHGGLPDSEQQRLVEDFGKERASVRLLLCSDVASEGLNLHYLCHRLIHFDLPWSLIRFSQRNGRIDRYGQPERPEITYLITESDNDRIAGDLRILELLADKDRKAQTGIDDPSAFMGQYDIDAEELITAEAMEAGRSAEDLARDLDQNLDDPFAHLLAEGEPEPRDLPPERRQLPSLFATDLDYLATALSELNREAAGDPRKEPIEHRVRPADKLVELKWPPDLRRRFKKLPAEVRPADGWLLLTSDRDRMQRAMVEARKEESAWPSHQLLWPLSPVLAWAADRFRGAFGRHAAPIVKTPARTLKADVVFLVSGLLPNQRGTPVIHRWFAVPFSERGAKLECEGSQPAEALLDRLRGLELPNYEGEPRFSPAQLQSYLPRAVGEVDRAVRAEAARFRRDTEERFNSEMDRLDRLRDQRLARVAKRWEGRDDALSRARAEKEAERTRRLFGQTRKFVEESLIPAAQPFIQVIACLVEAP